MPANVLQRWTTEKLTHNIWGIFRFARTYVTCSQQQIQSKQCHNRHKIQRANRGKHRFIEAQRLLTHTQNYQPKNCVRGMFLPPEIPQFTLKFYFHPKTTQKIAPNFPLIFR